MSCYFLDQTIILSDQISPENLMRHKVRKFEAFEVCRGRQCGLIAEDICERPSENHTSNWDWEFRETHCAYWPECDVQVMVANGNEHLKEDCKCTSEVCEFRRGKTNLNKVKDHKEADCPANSVVCEKCNEDGIPKRKFSQLFPNQCTTMMELNGNQGQRPLSQSKRCPTKAHLDGSDSDDDDDNPNEDNDDDNHVDNDEDPDDEDDDHGDDYEDDDDDDDDDVDDYKDDNDDDDNEDDNDDNDDDDHEGDNDDNNGDDNEGDNDDDDDDLDQVIKDFLYNTVYVQYEL